MLSGILVFLWKCVVFWFTIASILWVLAFTSPAASATLAKLYKIGAGFVTMALSTDKRWKKPSHDPDQIKDAKDARKKRIIFIRHGESDWNEVFNRGFGPSFPGRVISAILRELKLAETQDSVFLDSGLSPLGMQQAKELVQFLESAPIAKAGDNPELHSILRGEGASDSVIMSSNLRRALATAAIGLQRRLKSTRERVLICSELQEITFNLDGNALAGPNQVPDLHSIKPAMWPGCDPPQLFDAALNSGDKPIFGNGLQRMLSFCDLAFSRNESTIIAVGHSLYFRSFFRTFLPHGAEHEAKKLKMVNAGTVAFDLTCATASDGTTLHRIDPDSISVFYGGFTK